MSSRFLVLKIGRKEFSFTRFRENVDIGAWKTIVWF